ncbi:carbohydrate kinase family protein [Streptosporangium vulgare]|uniref:Carbohydrate kinase family protein n=1 Tax=Streptosporangium vulgare TaxID=46190 RepID=A0ABV5TAY3_9ACTN
MSPAAASEFDLLVVGDANPDVVLSGAPRGLAYGQREELVAGGALVLGGSGAITACGAARLGLRTAFAGLVGDDEAGGFVLRSLSERGVDVSLCAVGEWPTALTVVLVNGEDRAILTAPGSLPHMTVDGLPADLARHVHASSYFLQPALAEGLPAFFERVRRAGATTSLDTNDDPEGRWLGLDGVLAVTDVLLPNAAEALALAAAGARGPGDLASGVPVPGVRAPGDPEAGRLERAGPEADRLERAVEALAGRGPLPVVKNGAAGTLSWADGGLVRVAAPPADPVDTVGAGDSFNAGFLAARLRGLTLRESMRVAAACGSLSTRAAGGTAAQPGWDEVHSL